ncbi:MAG: NUDIX hydrolase [Kiritimatiellae bacterium]|nr:NUDIX hydrolase [Kiritimatiellia bacterium]MDW8459429.1 NUDIX hydrolase [Verrucomicrobiota bacterium]
MTAPQDRSPRTVLCEGKWLRFVSESGWEYVEHRRVRGVVIVIARTPEDRLVLVDQYRVPLKRRVLELPAGLVGDGAASDDEAFADAARRELLEETGYWAGRIEFLFDGPMSPGRSPDFYSFFLAENLEKRGRGGGDGTEDIRVEEMPLDGAEGWLDARRKAGELIDPKIYIALYFLTRVRAG